MPAELVEEYEALLDREDGRIARQRLDEYESGGAGPVPADEVARELGL
ncbi:hypothetical protein FHX42_000665 [Saccharopolyspora lacisalsi]|uniref:Uncharacterized protein n=1 Tax=Halosaccharopolyspora lacisalsi TaxID=1000566 RepID=A0A839DSU3_9PSEU|nr:hypothetical protein [Halosaccharopolyspora lacisalsi]MBA8823336.1 hypothetical protein [Halosaccharopolyspora lacisalsi]